MHRDRIHDLELESNMKIAQLVEKFGGVSFNARKLHKAAKIWLAALNDNARIYFALAGAFTPTGFRRVISRAIDANLIDVVIATGANIVHDALQAYPDSHKKGSEYANDMKLRKKKIMRIFDTFVMYHRWQKLDDWLEYEFYPSLVENTNDNNVHILPSEFFYKIGEVLYKNNDNGLLATAYKKKVPIYCPAFVDCAFGIILHWANNLGLKQKNKKIIVDEISDFTNLVSDMDAYQNRCAIIVGGGTPKNFAFQASISFKEDAKCGFNYAIQLTTDMPQFGGLSGATLREAISWGKVNTKKSVTVYSDASITLPLIIEYVLEKYKGER
jgi:deoxyhypusine synthase